MDYKEKKSHPIDLKLLKKYNYGKGIKVNNLKRGTRMHEVKKTERKTLKSQQLAARAEILLPANHGLLEATDDSNTAYVSQSDIKKAVDITAATKSFSLELKQFGPYKFCYSLDGRNLALAGHLGHISSFDWITKKLHCEINTMESIEDISYLHNQEMMAVAQKNWTYVYDQQGIELHCLKKLYRVSKLEFLPYHFLLCSGSENGFLSWLDITLGKEIIQTQTNKGSLDVLCQNPFNAVLCCGHSTGVVTMWTPNTKEAVFSMLAHNQPIKALAVDPYGRYMASSSLDRSFKLWDLRNLGNPLGFYKIGSSASNVAFSQKGLLAVSIKNFVEIYKNVTSNITMYMRNEIASSITGLSFSPYEDVLGVSHYRGFSSLVVPGSGEPNFDALERNPYSSKSARREAEVKSLLEKVPSDSITLDPLHLKKVHIPSLEDRLELKKSLGYVKVPKILIDPKYKMKGKSDSSQCFARKQKIRERKQREFLEGLKIAKESSSNEQLEMVNKDARKSDDIFDRFKPKRRKK